jgi:seryl-tRNA synthetase
MLDIKFIRENARKVKDGMVKKNKKIDIDELISLDDRRRELIFETEQKKAEQNAASKLVPQYKKEGKDTTEVFARMKAISEEIKEADGKLREYRKKIQLFLYEISQYPERPGRREKTATTMWS